MAKCVEKKSKMVSKTEGFRWIISDFSIEMLGTITSPPFKHFNRDFHFEVSRSKEKIRLRLVQSNSGVAPRISVYSIGFCEPGFSDEWHGNYFYAPVKSTDLSCEVAIAKIKEKCIADNELTIQCVLDVSRVKHTLDAQSVTPDVGNGKTFTKRGEKTLVESIGTILEDSRFSDVVLKVGEEVFQAHKAILASRSKVFSGMFQSGMKETQECVVEIAEMKPTVLKKMLQYIYAGTAEDLSMDSAIDLYVASDRYHLQELKGWCKEFILEHISSDDVCRVAVVADLHSDEELAKASRRVFKENPKTIMESEAWRDFRKENPSLLTDFLENAFLNDY